LGTRKWKGVGVAVGVVGVEEVATVAVAVSVREVYESMNEGVCCG
jgi:hypothetical protein